MSDKSGSSFPWAKVLVPAAVLIAAFFAVRAYLTPTAKVVAVISGEAVDAKPGSVTVKEKYSMEMKSAVEGRVLAKGFNLDTGSVIKEGDVLVRLDPGDIDIVIEQARNSVNSMKQRIALGSSAQFELATAEADFKNSERLHTLGQISDNEYQKALRGVETIKQKLALEKVQNEEDLNTYESNLKEAELKKEKMTILAPFDGEVSYVNAHPGDLISSGSPIVTLITTARIVEAKISEEDFANIRKGQKATVIFLPYGEWNYNGTVEKVLPTADPETQRHLVDLNITDIEPAKLIPGITGEVTIEVGRRQAKAIIPRRALINDNVYVVTPEGKVELRQVKKGYVWLTGAEILEGLETGEKVIVEDLDSFRDGDHVKTVELPSDAIAKRK